jgi:YHS domain-containing protein
MAEDVVCGMEVDEQRAAAKSAYEGRSYYFCSPGCQRRLEADPARYSGPWIAHQGATHQLTVQPGKGGLCVRSYVRSRDRLVR